MMRRSVAWVLFGLACLAAGPPPVMAQEAGELIAPYLRAAADKEVGTVTASASGDARNPASPAVPYEGVSIMLLPYSPAVERQLDAIREHLRDSIKHYMDAAVDVSDARTAYERALLWAGGGELVRGAVSDAKGVATLPGVPSGEWLLIGWREQPQSGKPAKLRARETAGFRDIPLSAGYALVTYWRMRVTVAANGVASVELNDRNVWMTGVKEETYFVEGAPSKKTQSKKQHR